MSCNLGDKIEEYYKRIGDPRAELQAASNAAVSAARTGSRNLVEEAVSDLQFQYKYMLGQMPNSPGADYEEWKKAVKSFSEREEVKLDTEVSKLCQALIKKHGIA